MADCFEGNVVDDVDALGAVDRDRLHRIAGPVSIKVEDVVTLRCKNRNVPC